MAIIVGTAGADSLVGTNSADDISGGGGWDTIRGLGGSDSLSGGFGLDQIFGGEGNDLITNDDAHGFDTLRGENGRDFLSCEGGGGSSFLDGGEERDTLVGGLGGDTLAGGIDELRDAYVFERGSVGEGVDTIRQFRLGDQIALENLGIDHYGTGEGGVKARDLSGGGIMIDVNGIEDFRIFIDTNANASAFDASDFVFA
jgi:Ca2+-binding RTX toxin-like protein